MPNDNEVEVARNRYGVVVHHPAAALLELCWLPTTAHMADEDWKAALELLAGQAEDHERRERYAGGLPRHSNWHK